MKSIAKTNEYYRSLSEAEWEQAEAIEGKIAASLTEGLREDEAKAFVAAVMLLRKTHPGTTVTVEGVFNLALHLGLEAAVSRLCPKKRRGTLTGKGL